MAFFNNKRKDFSIQPPRQQVDGTPFFVTDSANIDFTLANLNLTANLTTTGVIANTYGDSTNIPVLEIDQWGRITGVTTIGIGGGGGTYTVNNGLSPQTTPTANANNFQLGGALTKPTTITASSGNQLTISSTTATPLSVTTTGSSQPALSLQSTTGPCLTVTSSDFVGIQSTSGQGNYAANLATNHPTINNDILPVLLAFAYPGAYPTLNGFGASFDFKLATTSAGVNGISNRLISKWTDATHATRTSEFEITTVNNTVESTALTLKGTGQLQLNKYTGTTFDGTAVYALGVDASGNVITTTASPVSGDSISPFLLMGG
jgi:hypothetical protein